MIYLDNSATTRALDEVVELVNSYYKENYFNPSALYKGSLRVKNDIEKARKNVAEALGCQSEEIIFTSGGSESNNTAIFGGVKNKNGRIITTLGEHLAVYVPFNELKNKGYDVQYVRLNEDGQANLEHYKSLLNSNTVFVSLIHASNETGAVNCVREFANLAKKANPKCLVHSDGVQAFLKTDINVKMLNVDMYSVSGHKVHCPKGIGALYVKKGVNINPLIYGASQEYGLRAGTENVPLICALGLACNCLKPSISERVAYCNQLKEVFVSVIKNESENFIINGNMQTGLSNILSLSFAGIKSEILIQMMSDKGIFLGSGSACSSKQKVSRVLKEIPVSAKYIEGSIRVSFSQYNTIEESETAAKELAKNIKILRNIMR